MIDKTTIVNKDLNQLIKRNKFQFAMTQVEKSNLLLKILLMRQTRVCLEMIDFTKITYDSTSTFWRQSTIIGK